VKKARDKLNAIQILERILPLQHIKSKTKSVIRALLVSGSAVSTTLAFAQTTSAQVAVTADSEPTGCFTINGPTGAGFILKTIADGESTSLTYTCEVN